MTRHIDSISVETKGSWSWKGGRTQALWCVVMRGKLWGFYCYESHARRVASGLRGSERVEGLPDFETWIPPWADDACDAPASNPWDTMETKPNQLQPGMNVQRTFDPQDIQHYTSACQDATESEIGMIVRIEHYPDRSYYVAHWPSSGSRDLYYAIPEPGHTGYLKRAEAKRA